MAALSILRTTSSLTESVFQTLDLHQEEAARRIDSKLEESLCQAKKGPVLPKLVTRAGYQDKLPNRGNMCPCEQRSKYSYVGGSGLAATSPRTARVSPRPAVNYPEFVLCRFQALALLR